jgi:Na+/proline symporter
MNQIQAWDYVVLSLILFISISIGLYHGFKEKLKKIWFIFRRKNKINDETSVESETNNNGKTTDYLIATSSMRTIPVAFSLLATYYSATSLLGFPAEIYQYGIQYWLAVFAQSLSPIIGAFVTLPFLANFNIISVFEYFELRFDSSKYVRLVAVACYFIRNLISCAIFMYGPATSLALLVNFDEKICIAMIGVIATFYTTIGGIRGVIWNDLFQALIMFATLILIVTKGQI